ncbi:MAG TPA: DUF4097 family beta strand repeat-containing protein [Gemmatimonadales bacterium]|jgi:hypothetical protein
MSNYRHAVLLMLLALPATAAAQTRVTSGQRVTSTSQRIEIYDAAGTVTLHHGGSATEITATAQGADGSQLQFETDEDGGRMRFRVIFPDVSTIASPDGSRGGTSNLNLRSDGTFGGDQGRRFSRGNDVRIGGNGGFRGYANIEVTVPDGKEVVVHVAVGKADADGVNGNVTLDTWAADASATNVSGDWLLDTGSGSATINGLRSGSVKLDTGSGNGSATDVSGDLLDIDTGSGGADATNVTVTRFRFDTGSGDVRATRVHSARGTVDTGSGTVDLAYSDGPIDDLSIDTGSGRVTLGLPQNVDARLTIDNNDHDITLDRQGAIYERRGDDGTVLRFGEGHGRIKIDTGSGRIAIR